MCVYLWKQNKKHMTLSASKSVCGQELDIVVDYDPKEREILEVLEICINKVDVSPTLLHFGMEDAILDCIDWHEIYHDQLNQFNHF